MLRTRNRCPISPQARNPHQLQLVIDQSPLSVSSPAPPSILSSPAPPSILSSPAPPSILSSPPPPSSWSLPAPPSTLSVPSPPLTTSSPPPRHIRQLQQAIEHTITTMLGGTLNGRKIVDDRNVAASSVLALLAN